MHIRCSQINILNLTIEEFEPHQTNESPAVEEEGVDQAEIDVDTKAKDSKNDAKPSASARNANRRSNELIQHLSLKLCENDC